MTDLIIRPLAAGEENLFDSMPDQLPEVRKVAYADGLAGGGYRPERTWIALHDGELVARAAWLLLPGAVGEPWLERFELTADPEVGAALLDAAHQAFGGPTKYYAAVPAQWRTRPGIRAAAERPMAAARLAGLIEREERHRFSWTGDHIPIPSGRFTLRRPENAAQITALVARIAEPDLLTGSETARMMRGVDLARTPLDWLSGPLDDWRIAYRDGEPAGLVGATLEACFAMIAYVGVLDESARVDLLADAVGRLSDAGAYEIIADVDGHRTPVIADVERLGLRPLRSRILFAPA
jgi:hypothetical protein